MPTNTQLQKPKMVDQIVTKNLQTPNGFGLMSRGPTAPINFNALSLNTPANTAAAKSPVPVTSPSTPAFPQQTQTPPTVPIPTSTTPPTNTTPPATTFGGILGSLRTTATTPNPTTSGAATGLTEYAKKTVPYTSQGASILSGAPTANTEIGRKAQDIADTYGKEIAKTGIMGANMQAGDLSTGTAPVGEGNAMLAANAASSKTAALSAAENAALAGTAQQLTAQNQTQSAGNNLAGIGETGTNAFTNAGNIGNTQQQIAQSGLGTALTAATPTGNFPFVFDPTTGTYSVSGGNLQETTASGVQQAIANPALYTSLRNAIQSTYGNAAAGMFDNAFIAAGGNPQQATAQGTAEASNIGTTVTTPTTIAASGLTQATQDYQSMSTAAATAKEQGDKIVGLVQSTGLNSLPANVLNKKLNQLSGELGSRNVAALTAAVNEAQSFYSAVLSGRGMTPTAADNQALANLNPNAQPAQIIASLNQLNSAMQTSLTNQYKLMQSYQQNVGTGGSSQTNVSSGDFSDANFY